MTGPANPLQDTVGILAPPAGRTIDALQSVAPLILNVAERDDALAYLDNDRRLRAQSVLQHAAQLTSMTEWDPGVLMPRLGCEAQTTVDLELYSLERFKRCERFLGLVGRTAGLVSTVRDRRSVVMLCATLLKEIGQDADGLESALRMPASHQYSALDLIRLGEISAAGNAVREQHGTLRSSTHDGPYSSKPRAHISTPRLEAFVTGRADLLGDEVLGHITLHVEECSVCENAAASCREALGFSQPA